MFKTDLHDDIPGFGYLWNKEIEDTISEETAKAKDPREIKIREEMIRKEIAKANKLFDKLKNMRYGGANSVGFLSDCLKMRSKAQILVFEKAISLLVDAMNQRWSVEEINDANIRLLAHRKDISIKFLKP